MEELIAKIDAEIAVLTEIVVDLRQKIEEPESRLRKLHDARTALSDKPVRNTSGRGKRPSDGGIPFAERMADYLEANGPTGYCDLARAVNTSNQTVGNTIRGKKSHWFTQVNGQGSEYTLTEAGRNRHKTTEPQT